MRTTTVLFLLASMACSPAAFAESAAAPAPAKPDVVRVPAGPAYALGGEDFDGVQGSYQLSTGGTLRVWAVRRKLFADVGGAKTELVPVSSGVFVARGNDARLEFDPMPFAVAVKLTTGK